MPKGDPITLAEVAAVLGVKKTADIIPLCHPLPIDHTATKITMNESDYSLDVYCVVSAYAKTGGRNGSNHGSQYSLNYHL